MQFVEFGLGRRNLRKRPRRLGSAAAAAACAVEALEHRTLLTGTWTALANTLPSGDSASTMLLLSDGTVMINGAGSGAASKDWYRLTPNSGGSYVNGTFSTLADMSIERLYYASLVRPDGTVWVGGGEYSGPSTNFTMENSTELYDPLTNTWTSLADFPETDMGDVDSRILDDGTILTQYVHTGEAKLYNFGTNTWSANATLLRGDQHWEANWVRLADGSILTTEIWTAQPQHGQRWVPGATHADDEWVDAGEIPVNLTSALHEVGPGVLLADGRAFYIGATGHTALYNPGTNSWTAGPDIIDNTSTLRGANDAPAAVLPNGRVLLVAGPTNGFGSPTLFFEYDPVANTMTQVTASGPSSGVSPYQNRMLVLPNGQVLLANASGQLYVYNHDGSALTAGRPAVTSIVASGSGFTLTGTGLNGISEGAYYGDDAQMSSNYPIVKLTNSAGTVTYARTFNWSSVRVQTGATPVTTQFTDSVSPGAYLLSVSAAGISSENVLFVEMGAGADNVIVRVDPLDSTKVQVLQSPGTVLGSFAKTSFTQIIVTGDSTNSTLTVDAANGNPIPLGGLRFDGGGGTNKLNVTGAPTATAVVVGASTVTVNGSAITYSNVQSFQFDGGGGNDSVYNTGVSIPMTLNGGAGNDTLQSGGANDSLNGAGGGDTYVFSGGAALGTDTVNEAAALDTDVLDFTNLQSALTLNLSLTGVRVVAGSLLSINLTSGSGIENVIASTFSTYADTITGNDRPNRIEAKAGNDTVRGGTGNDTIYGDAGLDSLFGGQNNDSLFGGADRDILVGDSDSLEPMGHDTLFGDGGNDDLFGDMNVAASYAGHSYGSGNDELHGGTENDLLQGDTRFDTVSRNGNDTLLGEDGTDTLWGDTGSGFDPNSSAYGHGTGNDLLDGGAAGDTIRGQHGNDTYRFLDTTLQTDAITENAYGGTADVLDFSGLSGNVSINLGSSANQLVSGSLTLSFPTSSNLNIENAKGGSGTDTITGNGLFNTIWGNGGADVISGGAGNDTLFGGAGNDELLGDADHDRLFGEADNDILIGGTGNDSLDGGAGGDRFYAAGDGVSWVDTINGGAGDGIDDTVEASDGNEILQNLP